MKAQGMPSLEALCEVDLVLKQFFHLSMGTSLVVASLSLILRHVAAPLNFFESYHDFSCRSLFFFRAKKKAPMEQGVAMLPIPCLTVSGFFTVEIACGNSRTGAASCSSAATQFCKSL